MILFLQLKIVSFTIDERAPVIHIQRVLHMQNIRCMKYTESFGHNTRKPSLYSQL